ncbi:MAG: SOS response-associated peptidase [Alphaproteobacteria bacterium]|nr:MAG: SOS response-associated peptidase [Alphaproteobacteria bacterium]
MCGRYAFYSPAEAMRHLFGVGAEHAIPPNYNIGPRQPVLIIRRGEKGVRELVAVEWGLVPEWAREIGTKPLNNARVETVREKPSFRSSIVRKRCLVPFDGWYEWRTEGGRKQPYYIRPVAGGPMAFAGIWSVWHGPNGDHWLETMAILTAPTVGPMRSLHHRRPLVVRPEQYEAWLQPHDPLPRGFLDSFDWVPETAFEWTPVSTRVNNVRFNDPGCLDAPEDDPQPSLF